jgi:hypothetical protein
MSYPRLNRLERFEQPTKFAPGKFSRLFKFNPVEFSPASAGMTYMWDSSGINQSFLKFIKAPFRQTKPLHHR